MTQPSCFGLVVQELQLECPPLGSSLGHCGIYIWAAASETEDRYTVSHMVTPWQRPCSLRSLVWTTSVGPGYSVSKKKKIILFVQILFRISKEKSPPSIQSEGDTWEGPVVRTMLLLSSRDVDNKLKSIHISQSRKRGPETSTYTPMKSRHK